MPGPRWVSTVRDPAVRVGGPRNQASAGHRLLIFLEKSGFCQVPVFQILPGAACSALLRSRHAEGLGRASPRPPRLPSHPPTSPGVPGQAARAPVPQAQARRSRGPVFSACPPPPAPPASGFWVLSLLHFFFFNVKDLGLTSCEPRGTFISHSEKMPPSRAGTGSRG